MATHSSILAWEIPGTEEPSGLQYMWSPRLSDQTVTAYRGLDGPELSAILHLRSQQV